MTVTVERAASFVEHAAQYAGLGWALVRCDGKAPKDNGWESSKPELPELVAGKWAHWGRQWNVGVVCGPSSIAVLDVDRDDDPDAACLGLLGLDEFPDTPIVRTGRGRLQVYYKDPGGLQKRARDGFELRVGAHQCLAPPSVHPDTGRTYEWLADRAPWEVELAELPTVLVDYFAANANGKTAAPVGDAILEGGTPGRNVTLASLAGTMRRRGMSEAEILAALQVTNRERCKPPLGEHEVKAIASSIATYRPAAASPPAIDDNPKPETGAAVFEITAVDWAPILTNGVPELEYVLEPYVPARKRIWAAGAAEAGKSILTAHWATVLTRAGRVVVYISQENGLEEETRRFVRLRPDFANLRLYVDQGLDLKIPRHVSAVIEAAQGASLVVIDTLTACWSGDEDSNKEIAAFDRDVLQPIIQETGASPLVLDHTGNPQPFVRRRGVSVFRGASAKGQKADHVLEIRATGESEFTIHHGKARGARKQPPRTFRVIDTADNGLDLIEVETSTGEKAAALADQLVDLITDAGELTTKKLREAAKGLGGTDLQSAAMKLLEQEDPPRVAVASEIVDTGKGRQRAKVWRPATETLFEEVA